ncbi:MAG: phosphoenolpyruvate hydrolase family protein [Actinobacteria bacterium]|nr:phosphoenolpyruvate hydrolase family protein [Actinomycetota bacterium]
MNKQFDRAEILRRLQTQIDAGIPILGAGCSAGIVAKCAEAGGADLIICYSTGRTRLMGLPTSAISGPPSNHVTLTMADELLNVVQDTPLIAGVEASDFEVLDLDRSLDRFLAAGFHGVINFPTAGLRDNLVSGGLAERRQFEAMAAGYRESTWGWSREVEMVRRLRERDVLTMVYVCSPADAAEMAGAGADVVCAHVGGTVGGMAGFEPRGDTAGLLAYSEKILAAAKAVNDEVIPIVHGGPFYDPASTAVIYEQTCAVGFVGASSVERIPIEEAVKGACEGFKAPRLK